MLIILAGYFLLLDTWIDTESVAQYVPVELAVIIGAVIICFGQMSLICLKQNMVLDVNNILARQLPPASEDPEPFAARPTTWQAPALVTVSLRDGIPQRVTMTT